jgi:hypothetical protein
VHHEVAVDHSTAPSTATARAPVPRRRARRVRRRPGEARHPPARVAKAAEIVDAAPDDHFILWHDLEDERRAIKAGAARRGRGVRLPRPRRPRAAVIDFSEGRIRLLATKPELSGSGCNFQRHCHRAIFVGVGFKFNDFIQAIHRIQRFQQPHPVRIDIIYAESEREVVRTLHGEVGAAQGADRDA